MTWLNAHTFSASEAVGSLINNIEPSKAPAHPLETGDDAVASNCKARCCKPSTSDDSGNHI
jgi:hypothetical protein